MRDLGSGPFNRPGAPGLVGKRFKESGPPERPSPAPFLLSIPPPILEKPMAIINDLPADLISHTSHLAFLEYDQLARRHEHSAARQKRRRPARSCTHPGARPRMPSSRSTSTQGI